MKLKLRQPLSPGVVVQLRIAGKIIMGEVRYWVPENTEFYVGIEIQDVFPIPGTSKQE